MRLFDSESKTSPSLLFFFSFLKSTWRARSHSLYSFWQKHRENAYEKKNRFPRGTTWDMGSGKTFFYEKSDSARINEKGKTKTSGRKKCEMSKRKKKPLPKECVWKFSLILTGFFFQRKNNRDEIIDFRTDVESCDVLLSAWHYLDI